MSKTRAAGAWLARTGRATIERSRQALPYLRYFEPARLQAFKVAAVAVLATNGITLAPQIGSAADTGIRWIGAALALVALAQGELTRPKVTSPATARELLLTPPPPENGPVDPIERSPLAIDSAPTMQTDPNEGE